MSDIKTPPSNIAAERAVLAGICQYGAEVYLDITDIIDIDCFLEPDNQILFKCVSKVLENSEKVDYSSILSAGNSLGVDLQSTEHSKYIKTLFNFQIIKENVRKHSTVLKKLDIIRKAQKATRNIFSDLNKLNGTESINDILKTIEGPIYDFSNTLSEKDNEKTELMGEGVDEFLENLENNAGCPVGIPTPFPLYNKLIGNGRRRGFVYLIASRPKTGKSTFAINDALHVAGKLGIPVLYLDSEMGKESQWPRILSNLSGLKIEEIESGSFKDNSFQKNKLKEAKEKLKQMGFYYRRMAGKEFQEVLSIIRRWVTQVVGQENGRTRDCLLIYDYFKLMESSSMEKMDEHQALGFQMQDLTNFCQLHDITCSAFVQVNRDGITKESSDIIAQSDRLLWFAGSVAIFKRKTPEEIQQDGPENGNLKLIPTEDQRFGPGLEPGDFINMKVDRERGIIQEGLTRYQLKQQTHAEGFEVVDEEDDNQEEF